MHNRALAALGLNYAYLAFAVDPPRLADAVRGLRVLGCAGFNVTIPHKETVMPLLDEVTPAARACGAVNCVCSREGRLIGHNTDGSGFVAALREAGVEPGGAVALVVGAGGAGRAVAFSLAEAGVSGLVVVDLQPQRAVGLADEVRAVRGISAHALHAADPALPQAVASADLLVNASPAGMHPDVDRMPLLPEWFRPGQVVADIVYTPRETRWLAEARRRGLRTVDGVGMFVHQGARSFELFTGQAAPVALMREVVCHHLQHG
jgi:shikimate dehydrogenase